jgi:restriction system protein
MIPDYQSLMRPVLEHAARGEVRIADLIGTISVELGLSEAERAELLPSGKQTIIANRIHWAKTYLKQAGFVASTRRGHFVITDRGREALANPSTRIDNQLLKQFSEFQAFQGRSTERPADSGAAVTVESPPVTPDEALRNAHRRIQESLAVDLIDRVRSASPAFFETLIVNLLLAMGYGGSSEEAGRALGRSGDDGIDGVIDQDPLGVDQVYIQAKRYAEGNTVGAGAIRDFFGGLSLKRASKGIFVTTSTFSPSAVETARGLGSRIVLIDGAHLARLMIRYNVGCRDEEILHLKKVDEDFFDTDI